MISERHTNQLRKGQHTGLQGGVFLLDGCCASAGWTTAKKNFTALKAGSDG